MFRRSCLNSNGAAHSACSNVPTLSISSGVDYTTLPFTDNIVLRFQERYWLDRSFSLYCMGQLGGRYHLTAQGINSNFQWLPIPFLCLFMFLYFLHRVKERELQDLDVLFCTSGNAINDPFKPLFSLFSAPFRWFWDSRLYKGAGGKVKDRTIS